MTKGKTVRYVYWQEEDWWLGYLEEFPDYWTQGQNLNELKENLISLYKELKFLSPYQDIER